jgi:hypothetical protein
LDELLRDEHYLESVKQKESDLYQLIQQYEAGFPNMQQVITQEVTTPDNMDDTAKDSDDYWSNQILNWTIKQWKWLMWEVREMRERSGFTASRVSLQSSLSAVWVNMTKSATRMTQPTVW